jgi:uncharacterized protein (DUF2384 family)
MLREVRAAVEASFPSRLDAFVLLNPPAHGTLGCAHEWHLGALIDDFDLDRDGPGLHRPLAPFVVRGISISISGLSADRQKIGADLLDRIDSTGIPIASLEKGLTFTEHLLWQRDQPDLHELVDGQPQRLPDEKQATRRIFRALTAAITAFGDWKAAQEWMRRCHFELGTSPWEVAATDWHGVVRVLRLLETAAPGCARYDPESSEILIGHPARNLLEEAERLAAIEAAHR